MNYWDKRYATGGTSGNGTDERFHNLRWDLINQYVPLLTDVIDVGCGDLSFWENETLPVGYVGVDESEIIIQRNKQQHPDKLFLRASSAEPLGIVAPVVFCISVLFHIMDDDLYKMTLINLCNMSIEYIFIYTWLENPIRKLWIFKAEKNDYEYFREPSGMDAILAEYGFKCLAINRDKTVDKCGAILVYRKG
jgi:hypothetical protein